MNDTLKQLHDEAAQTMRDARAAIATHGSAAAAIAATDRALEAIGTAEDPYGVKLHLHSMREALEHLKQ